MEWIALVRSVYFNRTLHGVLAEMSIYRDNLSTIVIGDNLLPIIAITQNSFDLSITDIAFVKYFVIANKLSL